VTGGCEAYTARKQAVKVQLRHVQKKEEKG
jgi:hypothetical protein